MGNCRFEVDVARRKGEEDRVFVTIIFPEEFPLHSSRYQIDLIKGTISGSDKRSFGDGHVRTLKSLALAATSWTERQLTAFDMQSGTLLEPNRAAFEARGITFTAIDRGGSLQVAAPAGGRVTFGDMGVFAGAVGSVFDAADRQIAAYTFAPGGPTGGRFSRLELVG